jgi:hypothetical protein
MERSVRTNLTPELLLALKSVAGMSPDNARVLGLNPPLVPSNNWDAILVRQVVADVINPPAKPLDPPAATGQAVTTTTLPAPKGSMSLEDEVADECRTRP